MSVQEHTKEGWKGIILPRKAAQPARYKQVLKKKEEKKRNELPEGNGPRFQVTVHRINVLSLSSRSTSTSFNVKIHRLIFFFS